MKKYHKILIVVCILLGGFLAAATASAALMPCGQGCEEMSTDGKVCFVAAPGVSLTQAQPCKLCHLWQLFSNVINFLIFRIAVPGAALLFAFSGIVLMTAGGNEDKIKRAKTIFTNTVIGLVIIFCSWLIVDTMLKTLGGGELTNIIGAWNKFPPCP